MTPITKICSECIPPISHMSPETCHTRVGTIMRLQLTRPRFNPCFRHFFLALFLALLALFLALFQHYKCT